MTVKIVTDSSSDIPADIAAELGITVVPLYVRFGEKVYRDRIDISDDEFYQRLQQDPVHPNTVQPTPQDFATVYQELAKDADGIVSVHISSKLSGTYNSALQGREMSENICPIKVIDSGTLSMALGFIAINAAKAAHEGKDYNGVVAEVAKVLPDIHLLGLLDTLKYLLLGGRIGKARALLGSVLNVKPLLTLKDGEVIPAGQVRTRSKGVERLLDFVNSASDIKDLAVVYNTTPDEAKTLTERLNAVVEQDNIQSARIGPLLGVHIGPGALVVAFWGKV